MKATQKTIKYLAIGFAAFLAFSIIAGIGGAVSSLVESLSGIEPEKNQNFSNTFSNVDSIEIDGYIYNIKIIEEGTEFHVDTKNVSRKYKCYVDNGTLKLKYSGHGLGWFSWLTNESSNKGGTITITIPSNFICESVKIDAGIGSIHFDSIRTKYLEIDAGTGEITGNNLTSEKSEIDCGIGNFDVTNVNLVNTDINCGTGNMSIEGTILGENVIDCGIGNLDMRLKGSLDDYNMKIDGGLGDIEINGEKYSDITWNNTTAENSLDISGGLGNINIDFE